VEEQSMKTIQIKTGKQTVFTVVLLLALVVSFSGCSGKTESSEADRAFSGSGAGGTDNGLAESDSAINSTNFPDPVFRAYIAAEIDKNHDGVLAPEEIAEVKEIYLAKKGILSLQGIHFFTELETLDCSNNQLTALDISKNSKLVQLQCFENQLTELDVSKNTLLKTFYCFSNQLTELDVSKNTSLTVLNCSHNQLADLDVSKNADLKWLDCYHNQLTELDISNNTQLKSLYCYYNQLTELDVSNNINLTHLFCANNLLTKMDLSNNTKLEEYDWKDSN
jgi:Leucine-rich repeat (LRR) protein